MPSGELEGAEEDANADPDAVGEEEGLAEVSDGVSHAGLVRAMIAGRGIEVEVVVGVSVSGGSALAALELLDGVAEVILRLAKAGALGVGIVGDRRRRRRRGRCHFSVSVCHVTTPFLNPKSQSVEKFV